MTTDYLKLLWKNKFSSNCVSTNSAGVIILYNNDYEVVEEYLDKDGRALIVAIKSEQKKYIVVNTYYPNDHKKSLVFSNNLYEEILRMQQNYPDFDTIYTGDINTCLTADDCLNRNRPKIEETLSTMIQENNKVIEVKDAYRSKNPTEGFTWRRGECYSRLDYVFLSKALISKVSKTKIDWAFEKSDHAALIVELFDDDTPTQGPGLIKINVKILDDPVVTKKIESEITEMMNQTDISWNSHARLEFLKVSIRSVFASKVMEIKRKINENITDLEEEINQIEELKLNIALEQSKLNCEKIFNVMKIDNAIFALKSKLHTLGTKLSESIKFISKAKWFEYGEKSNKFFLNLNKSRQKKKLISRMKDGNDEWTGQKEVSDGISKFYGKLYTAAPTIEEPENDFYKHCPKLSEENTKYMDENLTITELHRALLTCKDSAPGPDGIPYVVYKKFWNIAGPIVMNAWEHSLITNKLTLSHSESAITLLPKEGKDTEDIKNWRPITLSNCDSKIITKALAMKISKTLDSIIDPSQTAYVPGRAVSDNLRSNFFFKKHCKGKNINSVLISLDAKKAFDSVDHEYIKLTLQAYGFGEKFIKTFQVLYSNITARILVNGFTTEPIQIKRGVKQGDALSCAIFIICIDPILRNINKNSNIKSVRINRDKNFMYKAAAYADDISIICKNESESVQQVFKEYEKLTKRSGLELNADKTEILILNTENKSNFCFEYNDNSFDIT